MTDTMNGLPVAGWFPDPAGSSLLRWWDGAVWTADTLDPITGQPPVEYKPMQRSSEVYPTAIVRSRPHSYIGIPTATFAIWVFAAAPFLYMAMIWASVSLEQKIDPFPFGIIELCSFAIMWSLGMWDHSVLVSRGIPAASVLWMFLTPIGYLIARRIRLKDLGIVANAPGNAFVLSIVAAIVLSATAGTTIILSVNDRASITTLQSQLTSTLGRNTTTPWTVACPSDAPVATIGAVFICHASDTSGHAVDVKATVVSRDRFALALVPVQNPSTTS